VGGERIEKIYGNVKFVGGLKTAHRLEQQNFRNEENFQPGHDRRDTFPTTGKPR